MAYVKGLAVSPTDPDVIVAAIEAGAVVRSEDGGLPQPLVYMAYALLTDPAAPGHLYAGLANGHVWASADYGDRWRRLSVDLGGIHRSMIMI